MDEDKNRAPLLPISGLLILIAALGVTFFSQSPFKGSRPPVQEHPETYQKVKARLWQDPFGAILESEKRGEQPSPSGQFCMGGGCKDEGPKKVKDEIDKWDIVKVLGVMVPGGPYTEETEGRTRYRYAVLSGLSRVGFIPDDAEHIEFIKVVQSNKTKGTEERGASRELTLSNIMPFEWLTNEERGEAVLVVWMNDDEFGRNKNPLSNIRHLKRYLVPKESQKKNKITFMIIGPVTSTTLEIMAKEVCPKDAVYGIDSREFNVDPDITMYSAFATVDNAQLLNDRCRQSDSFTGCIRGQMGGRKDSMTDIMPHGPGGSGRQRVDEDEEYMREHCSYVVLKERMFRGYGIAFLRTIGPDSELVKNLVGELWLRGIDLTDRPFPGLKNRSHILLVAEWDTIYGRSFRRLFENMSIPISESKGSTPESKSRIHMISYVRGIDGSLPGEKEEKKDEKKTESKMDASSKNDPLNDVKKLEQPVGKSQYDYLRRLAEETYLLDKDLQANGGEIKAIGIVGTDFYDKYLVLQALRQRFPDILFFTTDLDARFLHPDHMKWTRNLVVASNFGLSLRKDYQIDIQGAIPPFRDNYQTSIFFTLLYAFRDHTCPDKTNDEYCLYKDVGDKLAKSTLPLKPLVFEIGRSRAIYLTHDDTKSPVHPRRDKSFGFIRQHWLALSFIMFFLPFFLLLLSPACVENRWKVFALLGGLATLILCAAVAMYISQLEGQEPFSVFEGVSVWPTELLRVVAIGLSIFFLVVAYRDLGKNTGFLDEQFGYNASGGQKFSEDRSKISILARAKNCVLRLRTIFDWQRYTLLGWESYQDRTEVPTKQTWTEYRQYDLTRNRRIAGAVILYALIGALITALDMPVVPSRGHLSTRIGWFVGILSGLLFVWLIFYVLDITKCCRKFITIASAEFSKRVLNQYQANTMRRVKEELDLIRLIAFRTEPVGKLVFYPFIVWLIMFIARLDYIDNWKTPIPLVVLISTGALLTWSCAFLLRRAAEQARTRAASRLKEMLLLAQAAEPLNHNLVEYIKSVIEEVKSIREGAFLPITQHPLVQALGLPFGGVGGVYLIEFFAR